MISCKPFPYLQCQPRTNSAGLPPKIDWYPHTKIGIPFENRMGVFNPGLKCFFKMAISVVSEWFPASLKPTATDPSSRFACRVLPPFSTQHHRLDTPLSGTSRPHGGPHGMHRRGQRRRHGHSGHSCGGMHHGEKGKTQKPVRTEKPWHKKCRFLGIS